MTNLSKILSLGATIAVIAITSPAQADPNLNCDAYASAAVAQHNHAKALGCGFGGGRWSANYHGHRNWCLSHGVGIMDVSNEDHLRKQALQQCGSRVAKCDSYAQKAVAAQAQNVSDQCGYTGGRWSANYNGHKNWCMGASDAAIASEEHKRGVGLSQCLIGNGINLPKT